MGHSLRPKLGLVRSVDPFYTFKRATQSRTKPTRSPPTAISVTKCKLSSNHQPTTLVYYQCSIHRPHSHTVPKRYFAFQKVHSRINILVKKSDTGITHTVRNLLVIGYNNQGKISFLRSPKRYVKKGTVSTEFLVKASLCRTGAPKSRKRLDHFPLFF